MKSNKFPFGTLLVAGIVTMMMSVAPAWAVKSGQPAPKTELESIKGDGVLKLSDLKGKIVLVDFWASWCPPCRKSLPLFNDLRSELSSYGFEVFAINVDEDKNDGIELYNSLNVAYPSGLDPKGKSAESWNVQGMPTSYLVDRNGVVRLVHTGFKDADIPHLKQEILKLINE